MSLIVSIKCSLCVVLENMLYTFNSWHFFGSACTGKDSFRLVSFNEGVFVTTQ